MENINLHNMHQLRGAEKHHWLWAQRVICTKAMLGLLGFGIAGGVQRGTGSVEFYLRRFVFLVAANLSWNWVCFLLALVHLVLVPPSHHRRAPSSAIFYTHFMSWRKSLVLFASLTLTPHLLSITRLKAVLSSSRKDDIILDFCRYN